MVRQGQENLVFLATYLPEKIYLRDTETNPIKARSFFDSFCGKLILHEVNKDFYVTYSYKNGIRQQSQANAQSATSNTQRTSSNCLLYVTCIWQLACNVTPDQAFNYPTNTLTFTYPDPDDPTCPEPSPSHECTYSYWVHTTSNTSLVCDAGYEPAPPLPSTNGNSSNAPGTVSTDPALASTVAALAWEMRFNDAALLGPCPEKANKWLPVINFKPPASVSNKLNSLVDGSFYKNPGAPEYASAFREWWYVQALKDAKGPVVNLDYYSVNFDNLPTIRLTIY